MVSVHVQVRAGAFLGQLGYPRSKLGAGVQCETEVGDCHVHDQHCHFWWEDVSTRRAGAGVAVFGAQSLVGEPACQATWVDGLAATVGASGEAVLVKDSG